MLTIAEFLVHAFGYPKLDHCNFYSAVQLKQIWCKILLCGSLNTVEYFAI